ncbi:MAG: hypothetical protein AAF806_02280 [Bacteroidota bacterium]
MGYIKEKEQVKWVGFHSCYTFFFFALVGEKERILGQKYIDFGTKPMYFCPKNPLRAAFRRRASKKRKSG